MGPNLTTKNFSQKGFTKNLLSLMKTREQQTICCSNYITGYEYTPTSTSDTHGDPGNIAYDNSFIYVKTTTGWKRSALSTF